MSAITNEWYKLDNAAKIYPASVSKYSTGTFRIAAFLHDDIKPEKLQRALEIAIGYFPTMAVTMKGGLFWYYLQPNNSIPIIEKETERPCQRIIASKHNGFHFRVLYYKNKVSLETFHVLTDGTGALTFLKAIISAYFDVAIEKPLVQKEFTEDSFKRYYNPKTKITKRPEGQKASQVKEYGLPIEGVLAYHGIVSSSKLKAKAKEKGVTITSYITALYLLAIYKHKDLLDHKTRPIVVSVPINLRKRFPSVSMRNFSYFTNINIRSDENQNLDCILKEVTNQLEKGTDLDILYAQIHSNVKIESNILFRIIPNLIKDGILKIAKHMFSGKSFTSNFSNLGLITLGDEISDKVDYFEFLLHAANPFKINLAVCTYGDQLVLSVTRRIKNREIVDELFDLIETEIDSKVTRYSNEEMIEV